MTWPLLTTHEPFGCGPATYVGSRFDGAAASPGRPSPAATSPASGRRRLTRDFFRDLFRILMEDIYRSPYSIFRYATFVEGFSRRVRRFSRRDLIEVLISSSISSRTRREHSVHQGHYSSFEKETAA